MKLIFSLFIVVSLCPSKLCCQKTKESNIFSRLPSSNTIRLDNRQKKVWTEKRMFFTINFQQSRNLSGVAETNYIRRSSSYAFPFLFGRKLRGKWSIEAGPFLGINRNAYQQTTMLQTEASTPSRIAPAYGVMAGFSRQLVDRLSLQIRVRKDFGSSLEAWEPVQLGWNMKF